MDTVGGSLARALLAPCHHVTRHCTRIVQTAERGYVVSRIARVLVRHEPISVERLAYRLCDVGPKPFDRRWLIGALPLPPSQHASPPRRATCAATRHGVGDAASSACAAPSDKRRNRAASRAPGRQPFDRDHRRKSHSAAADRRNGHRRRSFAAPPRHFATPSVDFPGALMAVP